MATSCATARPVGPSAGDRRVLIIGAGLCGLNAADHLARWGFDPLILEARGRVGGRVQSQVSFGGDGDPIEWGGEFIGLNHRRWHALADRFSLPLVEVVEEEGFEATRLQGKTLPAERAEALYAELDRVFATLTELAAGVDPMQPWAGPMAALDRVAVAQWWAEARMSELARIAVRAELECDNAAPLEEMSLLAMLAMIAGHGGESYWTETETHRCALGNQALAQAFANELGRGSILTHERVERIESTGDSSLRVITRSGRTEVASNVILTTPPPTWRQIQFSPDLLSQVLRSNVAAGPVRKFLAPVDRRFFAEAGRTADAFGDGLLGFVWEGGLAPGPASERTTMIGFSGGPALEGWNAYQADTEPQALLSEFEALQPGFTASHQRTGALIQRAEWARDPFARCGYGFPAPGQVTGALRHLREHQGPLFLAGEFSSSSYCGYMEGALEQGEAIASRVAGIAAGANASRT